MDTVNTVAAKEGFAEFKSAKLSTLGFFMALPPVLVIIVFVGLPIVVAFLFSIGYTEGPNRVISIIGQDVYSKDSWWGTSAAYLDVFKDPRFWPDFRLTLFVTFFSTFVVLVMALGMGLYQRIKGGRVASILSLLALVPLFVPVVIAAYAIANFYNGVGFVRTFMAQFGIDFPVITSTRNAIVIGTIWTSLPFAILMITSGLQSVPNALIESAQDAGASFMRIVRTIMIPLAFVPIVIAGTFTSIGIMGSFTVPLFLGPNQPTLLGVEISNFFTAYNRPQQSIVMAFVIFAAASGIAVLYIWANIRSAKQSGRI
ncbi:MAG: ABC transporter permease subunit [Candidatus Planktophila sp.]